jgi:type IV pilus assembly protein PilW
MMALKKKFIKGMTLVELLVAMALGSVLLGGIVQVFVGSKQAYSFNEELGLIQENARFAIEFITRDVRMAGSWGCNKDIPVVNTLNPIVGPGNWKTNLTDGLGGFDGNDTGNAVFTGTPAEFPNVTPPAVTAGTVPISDVMTVSRLDTGAALRVTGHNAGPAASLQLSGHNFNKGDILIVTDCEQSSIFQHASVSTMNVIHSTGGGGLTPGNCTKGLGHGPVPLCSSTNGNSKQYGNDARVMAVSISAYYVDVAANGLPALYVKSVGNNAVATPNELVQGIENIQVLYGEDIDADGVPNRYVDATNVGTWANVVAAKIYLLARSFVTVASEPQDFSFMGTVYTPTDRFLRQEFISTVKIRNK